MYCSSHWKNTYISTCYVCPAILSSLQPETLQQHLEGRHCYYPGFVNKETGLEVLNIWPRDTANK